MIHAASTDIGQVRKKNEDNFLVDEGVGLFAVADGMGGHQAGEVASALALETLREQLRDVDRSADDNQEILATAIIAANRRVFEESIARGHVQGMGTTLCAIWCPDQDSGQLLIGHVGDSRCYRLRGDEFGQLTHDHSWVQVQVDEGVLSADEAAVHPMRNVVTRSIGFEPEIDVDVIAEPGRDGDVFLLASDGLTGKVNDDEIAGILKQARSQNGYRLAIEQLIDLANERGGEDNITVVILAT